MFFGKDILLAALLGLGVFGQGTPAARAQSYTITDLGNLGTSATGSSNSTAVAINSAGQVVGDSDVYDAGHIHRGTAAFLYSGGVMTNLGNFGADASGSSLSRAGGINAAGQVVGFSDVYDSSHNSRGYAGFLYSDGAMTALSNFGTDANGMSDSVAGCINDAGQVTGISEVYDASHTDKGPVAYLYSNGVMTSLGTLGTASNGYGLSYVTAINASGQVVGDSNVYNKNHGQTGQDAYLYSGGVMTDLGTLGTSTGPQVQSSAVAINDAGQVAGYSDVYDSSHIHRGLAAFLYSGGVMTNLGNFGTDATGYGISFATALNASGQVVGDSEVYDSSHNSKGQHAFLYRNGVMTDLGYLGANVGGSNLSNAAAINASGQIVGNSNVYDSSRHLTGTDGFLYSNGVMTDINSLVAPSLGWSDLQTTGINDAGQIIGTGTLNGQTEAFLMTPVTPPTNLHAAYAGGSVTLTWTASTTHGVTYYVYRGTSSGGENTRFATGLTNTTFVDKHPDYGHSDYYIVKSSVKSVFSAASAETSIAVPALTVPAAPTLSDKIGYGQIVLSWTVPTGPVTSYNLYRGTTAGGDSVTPYVTGLTSPSYKDTKAVPGTVYYYKVAALNAVGSGPASNEVSAAPQPPGAPTVKASASGGQVSLVWTAPTGSVTGYSVYRGTAPGGESAAPLAAGLTTTAYKDTTVTAGTTYYYKVIANNLAGPGPASNEAFAKS